MGEGQRGVHERGVHESQGPHSCPSAGPAITGTILLFFFFITLGLEMSDTKVYEPELRALLGIASRYCEAVVLRSEIVPSGTAQPAPVLASQVSIVRPRCRIICRAPFQDLSLHWSHSVLVV